MEEDAAGVADFKREVDEGFDDALADVSAAFAAIPLPAAMTLPGLEPASSPEVLVPDAEVLQAPGQDPHPLQGRLDLGTEEGHAVQDCDDAINSFAPDGTVNWGPHWRKLAHHDDELEGDT
ncbi:MAG TPA: hypothetical protein VHV50_06620 [Actinomycetota bacterium]|nr:hypothetical protein [Actinomycetota bacterium]